MQAAANPKGSPRANFDCLNKSNPFHTHFEKEGAITFHYLTNACAPSNGAHHVVKAAEPNETFAEFFQP
jgi:hypothetical protein